MHSAVVFDLYNTLACIAKADYLAAKRRMAALVGVGEPVFLELWRQHSRDSNRGDLLTAEERTARVLIDAGVRLDRDAIRRAADVEYSLQEQSVALIDGARELIDCVASLGLRLGLLSNTGFPTERVPAVLGIGPAFDAVQFSYASRTVKPGPATYARICSALGAPPADCFYVGDGDDQEIVGASSVGMTTILVRAPEDRLQYSAAVAASELVAADLNEVRHLITGLVSSERASGG